MYELEGITQYLIYAHIIWPPLNNTFFSHIPSFCPLFTISALETEQLRGIILFTRLLNLGVSLAVIVHSVLVFISFSLSPKHWVLGAYATCGGCLICCLETQLKFFRTAIAMNFGFLFNPLLRFVYYILLATVCLSFDDIFGKMLAAALAGIAIYNTYVLIKYPAYRKMRDELANEEDTRIQKRMREQVRKEATKQMFQKKWWNECAIGWYLLGRIHALIEELNLQPIFDFNKWESGQQAR